MNYDTGVNLENSIKFLENKAVEGREIDRCFWKYRLEYAKQAIDCGLGNPRAMIVHCLCISRKPIATYTMWHQNLAVKFPRSTVLTALDTLIRDRWITSRPMGKLGKWWQLNCDLVGISEHMALAVYEKYESKETGLDAPIWGQWWLENADFMNLPFFELTGSDENNG